jgi:hypothetical protein
VPLPVFDPQKTPMLCISPSDRPRRHSKATPLNPNRRNHTFMASGSNFQGDTQ